jgi:hypothetical protein
MARLVKKNSSVPPAANGKVYTLRVRRPGQGQFRDLPVRLPAAEPLPAVPHWVPTRAVECAAFVRRLSPSLVESDRLDRLITHPKMCDVWAMLERSGCSDKAGLVLLHAVMASGHLALVKRELVRWRRPYLQKANKLRHDAALVDGLMPQEARALREAAVAYETQAENLFPNDADPRVIARVRGQQTPLEVRGFLTLFAPAVCDLFALPERGKFVLWQRAKLISIVCKVLFPGTAMTPRLIQDRIRKLS